MIESGIAKIKNVEIYFEWINKDYISNNNPILVFLHHGLGSIEQWGSFPKKLSELCKCSALVYDRYGHGKSEQLKDSRSTEFIEQEASEFLPELLNFLEIKKSFILYGHSDGGSIALSYASLFPDKLIGLIVEAPHVMIEEVTIQGLMNSVFEFENGNLKELLEKYHKEKTDSMFYGWSEAWLEEGQEDWNILELIAEITVPTMVIYGDNDEYGTILQAYKIKENIKGKTTIVAIPNGNHFPHKQHESMILKKTTEFISKCIKKT